MKKKVLFMIINMNVGGTERALLNMIHTMPKEQYDVTVLMLEKYGDFLEYIPDRVHKTYLYGYSSMKNMLNKPPREVVKDLLLKGHFIKGVHFLYIYLLAKIFKDNSVMFKYLLKDYESIKKEYDLAIAYAGPMDFISYFIIHKVNAKKKIQWIHFDVEKIGFNPKFATKHYGKFNQIYTVSDEAKAKLIKKIPALKNKVNTYLNVISPNTVQKMALQGEGFTDNFNGIRMLTVGRLSEEKGQDLVIPIIAKLKSSGLHVRWYCIGEGNARSRYERLIKQYGVEEEVVLLGSKTNPYLFMKQCDIYVQPSRHEGYCITLAEARCLNKPIVTTNFTAATEQITHNETGLIVEAEVEQIYQAVNEMLNNFKKRKDFSNNLAKEKWHNPTQNKSLDNYF